MSVDKFLTSVPSANNASLTESTVLLGELTAVSLLHCAILCAQVSGCLKSVFTRYSKCFFYDYIMDSQIPIGFGARLLKKDNIHFAENDMGGVTLNLEEVNRAKAEAACAAKGGRLAMPKTKESYDLLVYLAMKKLGKQWDAIWIGLIDEATADGTHDFKYSDGEKYGDNGYMFPIEPSAWWRSFEVGVCMAYQNNTWVIADIRNRKEKAYFCQTR